jgi:alpha-mannosidase
LQQSLSAIASQISLPVPPQPHALPIVIFNSLNWQRSEVVSVALPQSGQDWAVYNLEGQQLPCQLGDNLTLLFCAIDIPAVGYRVFWLCQEQRPIPDFGVFPPAKDNSIGKYTNSVPAFDSSSQAKKYFEQKDWVLENEFLRVVVNSENGEFVQRY